MNNGWFKLGLFSIVGLVISISILGFVSDINTSAMNTQNGAYMQNAMSMPANSNNMNNMNVTGQPMNSYSDMNTQNQLNQMQMQLNQMQMQLQNLMNSNGQMQNGNNSTMNNNNMNNSGSGSGSGSGSSSGSGMSMMGM